MREVIVCVGLQASGKSTWARAWVAENPEHRKRVNRDDMRAMLDGGAWTPANERFVIRLRDHVITQALLSGLDVVVDDTNLRGSNFRDIVKVVEGAGVEATVRERFFPVELAEALERDSRRERPVGAAVIAATHDRYYARLLKGESGNRTEIVLKGESGPGIEWVNGAPKVVICDLDGTLALMGDRSPYDASRCDLVDRVNLPVLHCLDAMERSGHMIIFVSAREEKDRAPTERFIHSCGFSPDRLYMRQTGDSRKDAVVKREIFDTHIRGKFNVRFVLDDRNQVVREWRAMGLPCFQVAEGAF